MYGGTDARDGSVTGLGLVWAARRTGISFKYASHVGDNSMRWEVRHLITPSFSMEIPRQSLCTSGPQEARRARLADVGTVFCVFSEGGATPGETTGAAAMGGGGGGSGILTRIAWLAACSLSTWRAIWSWLTVICATVCRSAVRSIAIWCTSAGSMDGTTGTLGATAAGAVCAQMPLAAALSSQAAPPSSRSFA